MRGAQFMAASSLNRDHPCHYMAGRPPTPRHIKRTPSRHYQNILNSIPPLTDNYKKHIHTHITNRALQHLGPNSILGTRPPPIHPSERLLSRTDRVHLARLRCGHHPALLSYKRRLDDSVADVCPDCNTAQHTIRHIMESCPAHTILRARHNIVRVEDLWENPVRSSDFLRGAGLYGQ